MPTSPRRRRVTAPILLAAAVLLGACGAAVDPTQDLSTGEAIIGLADAIDGLREESAMLQDQVDSLRLVVARQDSALARIAAATGVPLPTR